MPSYTNGNFATETHLDAPVSHNHTVRPPDCLLRSLLALHGHDGVRRREVDGPDGREGSEGVLQVEARQRVVQVGHVQAVRAVLVNADGRRLAVEVHEGRWQERAGAAETKE